MPRILLPALIVALGLSGRAQAEDDAAFFTKSVQPILTERCIGCHGAEKQKGKLRLDSREAALKGGKSGAALVPGKPDESLLITAVRYTDDDLKMPPRNKKLSDEQIATLVDWVKRGAPWGATDAKDAKGGDQKKAEDAKKPEDKAKAP